MQLEIEVAEAVPAELRAGISAGLGEANARLVGPSQRRPLLAIVRGLAGQELPAGQGRTEDGQHDGVAGGLIGYTAWGWLYIEQLWVAEARRGTGLGGRLIAAAEQEAVRRGCRNAWIDTFNPDALRLYERLDYQVFGILEGFPPGHTRSFLRKRLATGDGSPSPDRVRSDGYCGTATPLKR